MSYVKHDAVIAVVFGTDGSFDLDQWLLNQTKEHQSLVTKTNALCNAYCTYFLAPDGSKEGWQDSFDADVFRGAFIEKAQQHCCNIVHVAFGGDYGSEYGTTIDYTSDRPDQEDEDDESEA